MKKLIKTAALLLSLSGVAMMSQSANAWWGGWAPIDGPWNDGPWNGPGYGYGPWGGGPWNYGPGWGGYGPGYGYGPGWGGYGPGYGYGPGCGGYGPGCGGGPWGVAPQTPIPAAPSNTN